VVQIYLGHGNKDKETSLCQGSTTILSADWGSLYCVRYNGRCMLNKEFNGTKQRYFMYEIWGFQRSEFIYCLFMVYLMSVSSSESIQSSGRKNMESWIGKGKEGSGRKIFLEILSTRRPTEKLARLQISAFESRAFRRQSRRSTHMTAILDSWKHGMSQPPARTPRNFSERYNT
jgi:hypothetical protein